MKSRYEPDQHHGGYPQIFEGRHMKKKRTKPLMPGNKVVCIKSDGRFGPQRGVIYTVRDVSTNDNETFINGDCIQLVEHYNPQQWYLSNRFERYENNELEDTRSYLELLADTGR